MCMYTQQFLITKEKIDLFVNIILTDAFNYTNVIIIGKQ